MTWQNTQLIYIYSSPPLKQILWNWGRLTLPESYHKLHTNYQIKQAVLNQNKYILSDTNWVCQIAHWNEYKTYIKQQYVVAFWDKLVTEPDWTYHKGD